MKNSILFLFCFALAIPSIASSAPSSGIEVRLAVSGQVQIDVPCQLTCRLEALLDAPNVKAVIKLPEGAVLASGDIEWQGNLAAGDNASFSILVIPRKTELLQIEAVAEYSPASGVSFGNADMIFLDLRTPGQGRHIEPYDFISENGPERGLIILSPSDIKTVVYKGEGPLALPSPPENNNNDDSLEPGVKGYITIVGRLLYHHPWDATGVYRPIVNASIWAYDEDTWPNPDDYLGSCVSGWDGRFSIKKDISQHRVGEWRMPDWLPDGRIVHIRYIKGIGGFPEIFIMDSMGLNPKRVT